jgi:hypothetical protein
MTGDQSTITLRRMLDGVADDDVAELRALAEAVTTEDAERRSAARFFAEFREVE